MYSKLESLRGVAAVTVLFYHSSFYLGDPTRSPLGNGYLLVDLFFVLSGWVMSHAYQKKIAEGMDLGDYLVLRLGRIYPLHVFVLLMWVPYIAVKAMAYQSGMGANDPLIANNSYTFVTNLLLMNSIGLHDATTWNGPSWSISAEFIAYVLFFVLLRSADRSRRLLVPAAIAVIAYSIVYNITSGRSLDVSNDYGYLRCIGGFYAGVFLYRVVARLPLIRHSWVGGIELLAVLAVGAAVVGPRATGVQLYAAPLVFMFAIYAFASTASGPLGALMEHGVLRRLGTYSYSIYLVHALISAAFSNVAIYLLHVPTSGPNSEVTTPWAPAVNVAMFLVVVAVSAGTYRFVEEPFRRRARTWVAARQARPSSGSA